MGSKSFLGLVVATVLAVAGAFYSMQARDERLGLPSVPATLLPDLLDRVNEVVMVEVVSPAESFTIRRNADGSWGMVEKDGYPVLFETVKQAAVGIAALKPLEAKTARPEQYHRLRVDDPREDGGTKGKGTLIRLVGEDGGEVAGLILGKTRSISTSEREGWYYVRQAGQERTWLVSGRIEAHEKALRWLDTAMVQVARPRIRAITTIQTDGAEVRVSRPDSAAKNFAIQNMPEGMKAFHEGVANDLGSAFGYIAFDDVRKAGEIDFAGAAGARFETFDGLVVEVDIVEREGKKWARFKARHAADIAQPEGVAKEHEKHLKSADEVAKESEKINARFGPWAYNLPNYKAEELTKPMDKLASPIVKNDE